MRRGGSVGRFGEMSESNSVKSLRSDETWGLGRAFRVTPGSDSAEGALCCGDVFASRK